MARTLVIDDDPQIRKLIRQALEKAGHHVLEAENGAVGMAVFRKRRADLVITNIYMPDKEGMETIRELRQESADLPIIAVSGGPPRGNMDVLETARWLGASRTFAKPFDVKALIDSVAELLARTG